MNIMKEIGTHPNIVTLLGVCTEQGNLYLAKFRNVSIKVHNFTVVCFKPLASGYKILLCFKSLISKHTKYTSFQTFQNFAPFRALNTKISFYFAVFWTLNNKVLIFAMLQTLKINSQNMPWRYRIFADICRVLNIKQQDTQPIYTYSQYF